VCGGSDHSPERRRTAKKIKNTPMTKQSSPIASQLGLPVMKLPLIRPGSLTNPDTADEHG
jgi:hypothetical protein